jgi:hypothetical protein
MFDIRDKERSLAAGSKKDKDTLDWASEVLINKNDMEEIRQNCLDLENKVIDLCDVVQNFTYFLQNCTTCFFK